MSEIELREALDPLPLGERRDAGRKKPVFTGSAAAKIAKFAVLHERFERRGDGDARGLLRLWASVFYIPDKLLRSLERSCLQALAAGRAEQRTGRP